MSHSTLVFLGVASGVLNLIAIVPYVRDILRHKTKPERGSWWIWTWLSVVAFWAQWSAGAKQSLFLTGAILIANIIVALLSLNFGYGRFKQRDLIAICVAVAGIIAWKATNRPILALLIVIAVDFLGNWLTLEKSWRAPYSENLLSWVLISGSGLLGVLSVGSWDLAKIIFPAYVAVVTLSVAGLINYRRHWRSRKIKEGINT